MLAAVLVFGLGGVAGGAGARLLLARLPRGALLRPPWCEAVVGALWCVTGAAWSAGALPTAWVPALLGLSWLAVAAGSVDLLHHRLPDALTLPAVPAALLLLAPLGPVAVARGAVGAVVAVAAHGAVHLLVPRALGAGDVKLAGSLGAVAGAAAWPAVALAALTAVVVTAVVGAAGLATRALARGSPLPHGPSMLVAALLVTGCWVVTAGAGHPGGR